MSAGGVSAQQLTEIEQRLTQCLAGNFGGEEAHAALWDVAVLVEAVKTLRGIGGELLAELRSIEWAGCDPSAMPVCEWCGRDRPDEAPDHDVDESHNAGCGWLALVRRAAAVLGTRS